MSQIFISHAEGDGQVARDLSVELEKAGFKVWFYERDSLPGATYISQVAEALRECRAVVVIVSPASLKSDQVTNEIVRAYEGHKHFMPVLYGITHEEFREARDDWRQCLGASTSIAVSEQGVAAIVPRIARGLEHLGIKPGEAPEPKPTPVRAAEPTRPESKPELARPEPKQEPVAKPTSPAPKPERRPPAPRRKSSPWLWAGIGAAVVIAVVVAMLKWTLTPVKGDSVRTKNIVSGPLEIPHGVYETFSFAVTESMKSPRLEGKLESHGGMDALITLLILDDANFGLWKNGRNYQPLYGPYTVNYKAIRLELPASNPATYYIVYDNRRATVHERTVETTVDLVYRQQGP